MEKIKNIIKNLRYSYRSLPSKKQYIEFFTALLTIPVLLTVIILNLSNLKNSNKPPSSQAKEESKPIIVTVPVEKNRQVSEEKPSPTQEICKKEIGPVNIVSPEENETVTDNPVIISVDYDQDTYCAIVWAYRVNNGRYSEYDNKSIALYNPPKGKITVDLKIKSVVTGEEKILTRNFYYAGESSNSDQSITPTASPSAR